MNYDVYKQLKHCRWCGIAYNADKPIGKDGFCSAAHKQAHYRAYKSYVTAISDIAGSQGSSSKRKR